MTAMPTEVAEIRGEICRRCPSPCAQRDNLDFHRDPCSACPNSPALWGMYGRCATFAAPSRPAPILKGEPAAPTAVELATNFAGAMQRWATAGFPTATAEQYAARTAACEACELWDGSARFGAGKCNAPGCGCTRFKRWLTTETCKHPTGPRWPRLP